MNIYYRHLKEEIYRKYGHLKLNHKFLKRYGLTLDKAIFIDMVLMALDKGELSAFDLFTNCKEIILKPIDTGYTTPRKRRLFNNHTFFVVGFPHIIKVSEDMYEEVMKFFKTGIQAGKLFDKNGKPLNLSESRKEDCKYFVVC